MFFSQEMTTKMLNAIYLLVCLVTGIVFNTFVINSQKKKKKNGQIQPPMTVLLLKFQN